MAQPPYSRTAQPAWQVPSIRLHNELKPQERAQLEAIRTEEMLTSHLTLLSTRQNSLRNNETKVRLEKVVTLLKPMAQAADLLAQGVCLPSQTLWGALGLIVDLLSSRVETLDMVLQTFNTLLSALPRTETFGPALEQSPYLKLAISEAYEAYTTLSSRSLKIFGRNSGKFAWFSTFLWMRDRKLIQNSIQNLEALVRRANQEAGHVLQASRTDEIRETLRKTEELLSLVSLKNGGAQNQYKAGGTRFICPARNPSFVGRNARLGEMHTSLCPPGHGKKPDGQPPRSVVLCGLGGVGKSQLAVEYMHRYRTSFQACFWVTCDSAVKAAEGFSEIGRDLGLDGSGVSQVVSNVKEWLQGTTETWLLVLDNVESPADIRDFWPSFGNGSVLVTTQDSSWLSQEYISKGFRLDTLMLDEAVDLVTKLFERNSRKILPDDALTLAKETGGLPLAIRQIASYMLAESLTTEKFLKLYHNHRSSKRVDEWDESTTPWYSHTLATFLNVAFAKLSPGALLILSVISFLDVDEIQEDLFWDWDGSIEHDAEAENPFDGPIQ
ncbi:P-loop containing nucleoside triphosphate hydrolase protein [Cercophora newfieldiana]|uniref:P-loop containing nucleoside triphosphate hydrolase protein n=1 Tax=Cercophora newfieldiana TaxID=92897 RepID=A0AA40CLF0_9PEZI|nr:P-loop containing nucleoside triphosphate hydrolase protein [Cercophora newfieldiana]